MTKEAIEAKDKVLAVYPDARFCPSYLDKGMIISGDPENYRFHGTSWGNTNEPAAWIDAASRLPKPVEAEPVEKQIVTLCEEHGFHNCSVCLHDEPGMPSPSSDGFREWLDANSAGMEGEDDTESLMHVAWRAALLKSLETSKGSGSC